MLAGDDYARRLIQPCKFDDQEWRPIRPVTIKICIIGSCVSEDWYFHQHAARELDVDLTPRYQPSALVSLMAEPISMAIDAGPGLNEHEATGLKADFDKSFLSRLVEEKPDFLIVELLYDSRRGVIALNDSWITSGYILRRSGAPEEVKRLKDLSPIYNPDQYYRLFRDAAARFNLFMRKHLPRCQVVLHQARWAEFFVDDGGVLRSYPPNEQRTYFRANLRLMTLERIFLEEVSCNRLSVDDIPIFADSRHIWGPAADHYVKAYYHCFADQHRVLIGEGTDAGLENEFAPDHTGQVNPQ